MKTVRLLLLACVLLMSAFFASDCSASTAEAAQLPAHSNTVRYGLPPAVEKSGLVFAGQMVPLERHDVRDRILREINYLLMDRRSKTTAWIAKADSLKPVISPILKSYDVPQEFIYLAAIESSYNGRALSSAGAYGFWQFMKATAMCGPAGCDQYDWKRIINHWKDERADLVKSTHSAARYLAWMNRVKKVSLTAGQEKEGFGDWFLTAAAYNAGPGRVTQRLNGFGVSHYWEAPLPVETEKYVPRWIALGIISQNRSFYGLKPPVQPSVNFETVEKIKLSKDLSFAELAKMINTTPRLVWQLNSQIPADKSVFPARSGGTSLQHTINLPKGAKARFMTQLAANGYTRKNAK